MPVVRFSRDKRGYEHTYLIQPAQKKGAPARVLYWYRTPPGVKVGRPAFDRDVQRALEVQYPNIEFDWPSILGTTIPSAEVEHWRERRRAEKAAKQARRAAVRDDGTEQEAAVDLGAVDQDLTEPPTDVTQPGGDSLDGDGGVLHGEEGASTSGGEEVAREGESSRGDQSADERESADEDEGGEEEEEEEDDESAEPEGPIAADHPPRGAAELPQEIDSATTAALQPAPGRKRRRRGGRRRRRPQAGTRGGGQPPADLAPSDVNLSRSRPEPAD